MKSNGPWPVPSLVPPFCFDRNNEEWTNFPNAKREKNQEAHVTSIVRGRGALRGESWCHDAVRLPFPPTVPRRRPGPRAAAGRVPRPRPSPSRSAPSRVCPVPPPRSGPVPAPCGPFPPAPCPGYPRARSRPVRPRRGPGASRAGSIPARRSPGRRRMKKPPAPWKGQGAGIDADGKPTRSPSRPALRFPSRSQTPPTA